MIKVGSIKGYKLNAKGRNSPVYYTYDDVKFDIDGWADSKEYMPEDFDLCELKIDGKKGRPGWASGTKFDGLNIQNNDQVLFWKKRKEPREGRYATSKR